MKGGRVITFFLFALVAKYSLSHPINLTVMLNYPVTLCSGSCHGGVIELRHYQESQSGSIITKMVAKLDGDHLTTGEGFFKKRFENRDGKFSLTISSAEYNDMGLYECVCGKYKQHVNLQVLVPTEISAHVGGNVTLACHGLTNKMTKDSEIFVQWMKDGQNVSTISAGNITYGSGYKDRVSVSMDGYRKGDIFLNLTDLRLSDQGTYWCFFGPDHQRGNPGAVILTITPKEKPDDNTGMPTWVKVVVVVLVVVLVIILVADYCFLGGRLKETMAAWFKGTCLRSQFNPCLEGEQGGEHLSVTISESESETEEDRTGTRTCFVPYAPACIIRALSGPPSTTGLVTKATAGPPSTPGLVIKATDGPPSIPGLVTNGTD